MAEQMQYGGWYNNPAAGGKNQRWFNGVWTNGEEPGQSNNGGGGGTPSSGGSGFSMPTRPSINVQSIYESSFNTPEIKAAKDAITAKNAEIDLRKKQLAEAEGGINDNPYYAEATRVGKVSKLRDKAQADFSNLSGEVANLTNSYNSLRSDAETKVNMALKQYDVDSASYQQSLSQLNGMISAGALSGASSEDLASISAATGISSGMLQSVIKASQGQAEPYITTATDNAGNLSIITVDKATGQIINQETVGGVGKGKTGGSGGGSATNLNNDFASSLAGTKAINSGGAYVGVFPQLVAQYAPYMSLQDIYKKYSSTLTEQGKTWGKPKESAEYVNAIYTQARKGAQNSSTGSDLYK